MQMQEFSVSDFNKKNIKAFNIFFANHWEFLYEYAFRIVHDRMLAEDIVAECFLKLWQTTVIFQQEINIKRFLYSIVKNSAISIIRSSKLRTKRQNEYDYISAYEMITHIDGLEQFELSLKAQVVREIMKEVENLRPALRIVFKMSFFEGIPEQEIAQKLNMKVRSVYNSKHRALEILREKFKTLYT